MLVHLFYPDEVLKERLPGGPPELGGYIRSLQDWMAEHRRVFDPNAIGGRAIVVAVAPGGRARGWDVRESGLADPEADLMLDAAVRRGVPRVEHGPIAFAVHYSIPNPARDWNFGPADWVQAAEGALGEPDLDAVLESLL